MNILIVDMTHGGVSIATRFSKLKDHQVHALDIYKTLNAEEKAALVQSGIKLVGEDFLDGINHSFRECTLIAPVHCSLKCDMTHHDAVRYLLKGEIGIPVIEVTGVKGKTSVVWMLKEIFQDMNPLILSSLGVEVVESGVSIPLKHDISITPASILQALDLAEPYSVGMCIFETSLGGTGLADVGVITNIAEDYTIAKGDKRASQAKEQMFRSEVIVCDFDAHNQFYSQFQENVNTFGINPGATVSASDINYGMDKTSFKVKARDVKTRDGSLLNTSFYVETFAPAEHHVLNVLCAITASLSILTPLNHIIKGLKNFTGVRGRTSIRKHQKVKIIQEINPGINVMAIKKSVQMIEKLESPAVIFGGKYGITCEEIHEESTAQFLSELDRDIPLFLVDELGENIKNMVKRKYKYTHFNNAIKQAIQMNSKNILLIYRSNFSDINLR